MLLLFPLYHTALTTSNNDELKKQQKKFSVRDKGCSEWRAWSTPHIHSTTPFGNEYFQLHVWHYSDYMLSSKGLKKKGSKRGNLNMCSCVWFCFTHPNMKWKIQGQGRTLCNVQTLQCMIGDDDVEVKCIWIWKTMAWGLTSGKERRMEIYWVLLILTSGIDDMKCDIEWVLLRPARKEKNKSIWLKYSIKGFPHINAWSST